MNPHFIDILEEGIAAKRAGKYGEALACYDRARAMEPNDVRPYANMARLHTATGHYELALKYWLISCEDYIAKASSRTAVDQFQLHVCLQRFSTTIPWNGSNIQGQDIMIQLGSNRRLHFLLQNGLLADSSGQNQ